ALFFVGLAFKAALAPFHAWMPDAYSNAPATIPAMSSGVLVKALGVYALARLFFNVFGVDRWVSLILVTLAVLSMVLGSLLAFGQSNVKRLLGFSSISQIGYIFLGLGIGTPLSITAAVLHIFNHSVAKSLLFINAGEMEKACPGPDGKIPQAVDVRPAVRLSSLAGVLSICGVPPFAGFWSKLLIIISCLQARRPGLAFIAALVSMLTIAYYFKAYAPVVSGRTAPVTGEGRIPAGSIALTNSILFVLAMAALFGGLLLLPGYGKVLVNQASSVLINGVGHIAPIMGSLK
nr:proton-conducting transporter membrane subunit [Candidatus Omnitrophota bacterium]